MNKAEKQKEVDKAIEYLREYFPAGSTVYSNLLHVSSSGMSRHISVHVIGLRDDKNTPYIYNVSHLVAKVLEYRMTKNSNALVVSGCGMDMGFHITYTLARVLYRDEFKCIGNECNSNDHTNDCDGSWTRENNVGRLHSDAGYSLDHKWI